MLLDLRGNNFECPFPVFPAYVVHLQSDCVYPFQSYLVYGGILVGALCVALLLYVIWRSRVTVTSTSASRFRTSRVRACDTAGYQSWISYGVLLAWQWFGIVNDSVLEASIVQYLLSSDVFCDSINQGKL